MLEDGLTDSRWDMTYLTMQILIEGLALAAFQRIRDQSKSEAERKEREDFVVTACWHMRDRFNQREVWEQLGLPVEECLRIVDQSESMKVFRSRIFSRIVPTVKDIGLWGPQVQEAFAAMGAIEFAKVDAGALLENDARVAEDFDAGLRMRDAGPP